MAKRPTNNQPGYGRQDKGNAVGAPIGFQGRGKPHAGRLNQERKAKENAAVVRSMAGIGRRSKTSNDD